MKRIILSLLSVVVWGSANPLARAEHHIVAVLLSKDLPPHRDTLAGFSRVLDEKKVDVWLSQYDLQGDPAKGQQLVCQIAEKKPDLILALGTLATQIARKEISRIPIVFANVLYPHVSMSFENFQQPPPNVTGVSLDIAPEEVLKVLARLKSETKRVGLLYHSPELGPLIQEIRAAAAGAGMTLLAEKVESLDQLPEVLKSLNGKIDAFWMVADEYLFTPQSTQFILLETLRQRIPFIGLSPSYVKAGALFCLYWDSAEIGEQAGEIAEKILSTTRPDGIPVRRPRKNLLYLNEKVAEDLGIKIPADLREKATEIYK